VKRFIVILASGKGKHHSLRQRRKEKEELNTDLSCQIGIIQGCFFGGFSFENLKSEH
jgi:hypothetical protein